MYVRTMFFIRLKCWKCLCIQTPLTGFKDVIYFCETIQAFSVTYSNTDSSQSTSNLQIFMDNGNIQLNFSTSFTNIFLNLCLRFHCDTCMICFLFVSNSSSQFSMLMFLFMIIFHTVEFEELILTREPYLTWKTKNNLSIIYMEIYIYIYIKSVNICVSVSVYIYIYILYIYIYILYIYIYI